MVQLLKIGALADPRAACDPYIAKAVHFDGVNDCLHEGTELVGAIDSAKAIFSWWFDLTGGDDAVMTFFTNSNSDVSIRRRAGNDIRVLMRNPASTKLWEFTSDGLFTEATNPGWNHFLMAVSLIEGDVKAQVYMNDVALARTDTVSPIFGTINFTQPDVAIGRNIADSSYLNSDMAEFYINNGEFLDLTVTANRRKFISSSGKPVDLGSDGSLPTGTKPLIFLKGHTVIWHVNRGSGGGFTETGALTPAASSPSD